MLVRIRSGRREVVVVQIDAFVVIHSGDVAADGAARVDLLYQRRVAELGPGSELEHWRVHRAAQYRDEVQARDGQAAVVDSGGHVGPGCAAVTPSQGNPMLAAG